MPYDSTGPTGDGPRSGYDTAPVCNLHVFDCVTYIEHALALALSSRGADFLPFLICLRYCEGQVEYAARNHFFIADWLAGNSRFVRIVNPSRGITARRMISRHSFLSRAGIKSSLPDTTIELALWSIDSAVHAIESRSLAPGAYIVAFLRKGYRYIDANHAGLLFITDSTAVYRDASRMRGRVSEREPVSYFRKQESFLEGILLAVVLG